MDRASQRRLPLGASASPDTAARSPNTAQRAVAFWPAATDAIGLRRRPVGQRTVNSAAAVLADYEVLLRDLLHGVSASGVGKWESPEPPGRLSAQEWLDLVHAALQFVAATPRSSGPGDEERFREELGLRLTAAAAVMLQAKEARDRAWRSPRAAGEWHAIGIPANRSRGAPLTDTVPRFPRKVPRHGPRRRRARLPRPIVGVLPRRSGARTLHAKLEGSVREAASMGYLVCLFRAAAENRLARIAEKTRVERTLRDSRRTRG